MAPRKKALKKTAIPKAESHPSLGHCQRMLSLFSDYLDHQAKNRLCRRIEAHLRSCPDCRLYVDTLKRTVVLYRSLGREPVPDEVQKRLFATIRLDGFLKKKISPTQAGPKPKTAAKRQRR